LLGDKFNLFKKKYYSERVLDLNSSSTTHMQSLNKLFLQIIEEYKAHTPDSEWQILSILYNMSVIIYRNLLSTEIESIHIKNKLQCIGNVKNVLDYIYKKYDTNITIEEAALMSCYEKTSFCRAFKTATGMSFYQYLNWYRIDVAKMLLREGMYSIKKIGTLCGLPNAKSFTRVFKKYSGVTPSEYRNSFSTTHSKSQYAD